MKAAVALLSLVACSWAQEKKDLPKIMAVAPVVLTPASEVTLKFRGLKLDTATEVRFPAVPDLKAELGEKKAATVPTGLEAKDVGDKELSARVKLPATLTAGPIAIEVVTPEAVLKCELPVFDAASLLEEKEPNNGFAAAQFLEPGRRISGKIGEDKDVDVFKLPMKSGERIVIDVSAARNGSLLDATLTLYDARRHVMTQNDDSKTSDPALSFEAKADGDYFLVLQDAHDRGGPWHGYTLTINSRK